MTSLPPTFPIAYWCRLLPQIDFSVNIVRKFRQNPLLSALGVRGRRVPFQRHPHRSTRLRNDNPRKAKQKKDIWFQRKKGMVHSTMFQTLPNIQGNNGVNWSRNTIRHGTIQTSCHYNPPLNSRRQNSWSSTKVRQRNQTTAQKGSNGRTSCNRATYKGTSGRKKIKTPPQQRSIIKKQETLSSTQRRLPAIQ